MLGLAAGEAGAKEAKRARSSVVHVETADGVRLAADYFPPAPGRPVLVLLHGLGAGRGEWAPFISTLTAAGYGALAFDARGHGASGGPSFRTFLTPASWMRLERDMDAALAWLNERGIGPGRVVLAGASIGANIAVRTAARHPQVPLVVLLSAGYAYRGVRIERAVRALEAPLLIAAAPGDRYAYKTARAVIAWARHPESRFLKAASGHGVAMLAGRANQGFVRKLMRWLGRSAEKVRARRKKKAR